MHTIEPAATPSEGRTALITGAGSGIGRAFATELSRRGHRVHLLDIDHHAIAELATELGTPDRIQGDVADPSVKERAAASVGAVDLLCLNAGVVSAATGAAWEATATEWDRALQVNLFGVVNGLRTFVPIMLERGTPSQIIITASLAGAATWPGGGPYAALRAVEERRFAVIPSEWRKAVERRATDLASGARPELPGPSV